jgi:hypothetical protein
LHHNVHQSPTRGERQQYIHHTHAPAEGSTLPVPRTTLPGHAARLARIAIFALANQDQGDMRRAERSLSPPRRGEIAFAACVLQYYRLAMGATTLSIIAAFC